MDTQTKPLQMVEAVPDYSEVIRALQVIVKTGSQAAGEAVTAIRQLRQNRLPEQETFDAIVETFFEEGRRTLDQEEAELIASLLTVVEDYQLK